MRFTLSLTLKETQLPKYVLPYVCTYLIKIWSSTFTNQNPSCTKKKIIKLYKAVGRSENPGSGGSHNNVAGIIWSSAWYIVLTDMPNYGKSRAHSAPRLRQPRFMNIIRKINLHCSSTASIKSLSPFFYRLKHWSTV